MATTVDSLLDIRLASEPLITGLNEDELRLALQEAYNAIQILTNEVETIRIATGTAPPP